MTLGRESYLPEPQFLMSEMRMIILSGVGGGGRKPFLGENTLINLEVKRELYSVMSSMITFLEK